MPLKFKENSNLNLFQTLYHPIRSDFEVGTNSKVAPYVSNCRPAKFREFRMSGRTPI
jgi:hypothetical protein